MATVPHTVERRTPTPASPVNGQRFSSNGQRLLVSDVSWDDYVKIGEIFRDRPIRITYDRGNLEITTTSGKHERYKTLLAQLLRTVARELDVVIAGFGSFTHQRKDLERAIEPDECFYIKHFGEVRGKLNIDLEHDPPPDLAIEVEVTQSLLPRLGIFASLGIPEVWRFRDGELEVLLLNSKGEYVTSLNSPTFPSVPIAELTRFLPTGIEDGDAAMARACRAWVAEQLATPKSRKKPSRRKRKNT